MLSRLASLRRLSVLALLAALPVASASGRAFARSSADVAGASNTLIGAEHALNGGRVDAAVSTLRNLNAAGAGGGQSHLLLCRALLAEEMSDRAIPECEAAVAGLPGSSPTLDWMGRAYGMKAARSGPINGFVLARKVRDAFVAAVALDPRNGDAVNDLSEYYIGAPAVVGGGLDKATALADRVRGSLPQQAHRMLGMTAEKRQDLGTAEREFRAAVEVAHRPEAWADLGAFYSRRGDADKTVAAIRACIAADSAHDATLVDAASILNDAHREPDTAERLLRDYLRSPAQTDAAPTFRVHVMLGKMLLARGDKPAAKIEFESALSLASGYGPARDALQGL